MEKIIKDQLITYNYRAFDGTIFDSEKTCKDYEAEMSKAEYTSLGEIKYMYLDYFEQWVAIAYLKNRASFVDFINKVAKNAHFNFKPGPWFYNQWKDKYKNTYMCIHYDDRSDYVDFEFMPLAYLINNLTEELEARKAELTEINDFATHNDA